jgi:chemotaxis protein MotB
MSTRVMICAIGVAALLLSGNVGCYYDQLLQEQRANRTLREELGRAKQDLHDAESMNEILNTKIASLDDQLNTKQQHVDSLTAENESLRDKLAQAMAVADKMASKDLQPPVVVNQMLPAELDSAIKEFAAKFPDQVEYLPEKGAVRWKSDLLFELGSDDVRMESEAALRAFAEIVNSPSAQGFDVIVVGHTCDTPIRRPQTLAEHKTNWHLSAHRAISVMQQLSQFGVPEPRMGVMGYGEFRPIAPNTTEANKAQNRRVEIFLYPSEKVAATGTAAVYEAPGAGVSFARPSEVAGGGSEEQASPTPPNEPQP